MGGHGSTMVDEDQKLMKTVELQEFSYVMSDGS